MSKSKTHWKKLTNPNYLGTYALEPDEDMIVTINHVKKEEVTSPGGDKEECTVVYFKENVKPLILNVTNARQIENLYGTPYIEDWAGKKIQLYIKDDIEAFGKIVNGIRIRPKVPKTKKPELTPKHKKWGDAVENLARDNTTIKVIRKHYVLDEEMKEILLEDVQDFVESEQKEKEAEVV